MRTPELLLTLCGKQVMSKVEEISLPVALLLFFVVILAMFGLQSKELILEHISYIQMLVWELRWYISTYALLTFINCIICMLFLRRLFGLSKQGAKLRAIKKANGLHQWTHQGLLRLALGFGTGFCFYYFLFKDMGFDKNLAYYSQYSFFVVNVGFLFWFFLGKILSLFKKMNGVGKKLSPLPCEPNTIVLGSTQEEVIQQFGDEMSSLDPEWVSINRRGLNGSIFITGSVGSGKTAGAILPYFKQILTNFEKTSILALDPKRTFVVEAEKLIKKYKPDAVVRKISLDGKETFNPVYVKKPLKNSRYVDIAEMIRASAANFSGSGTLPFWDISSFNLIKNCVIFCAATRGYFTVKDIYQTMSRSITKDLSKSLVKVINQKDENKTYIFDDEERFNISCAIDYFTDEYQSFDEKVKTGILAMATSFLNQFQEYRASRVFCPTKEERTITSIDSVIDKGEILLFDVESPALARSMGTIIKLHFEQSVILRLGDPTRSCDIPAVLISDEVQDTVTTGGGSGFGDERFLAKCREANAICIAATQSLNSLFNTLKDDKAAKEYVQNFRTRITFHSSDWETIKNMQELVGQVERQRQSHSISEISQKTERNFILGGFDSTNANISESISVSEHREHKLTGNDFTSLKTFEAWGLVFDGVETQCRKLYMKPLFLKKPELPHERVLEMIKSQKSQKGQ